jgi:hypothetical protein
MSAGAAVLATRRIMRRDGPGVYVTVLPDSGLKYLSEPLFALDHELEVRAESPETPPGGALQPRPHAVPQPQARAAPQRPRPRRKRPREESA